MSLRLTQIATACEKDVTTRRTDGGLPFLGFFILAPQPIHNRSVCGSDVTNVGTMSQLHWADGNLVDCAPLRHASLSIPPVL